MDDIGCSQDDIKNYIPLLEMPAKSSEPIKSKGVLFSTYSTLVSKGGANKGSKGTQTRYDQIMYVLFWCYVIYYTHSYTGNGVEKILKE